MTHSIEAIPRAVRRRLKKTVHKSRDKDHARRAQAILLLAQGYCVTHVSELLSAARSSVQRWRGLYEEFGEEGLEPLERGRRCWTVTESLGEALADLLERSPNDFGYLSTRWNSELLALVLGEVYHISVHPSTIRRLLPRLGFVWRRARPILIQRDPKRNKKLKAIKASLQRRRGTEVFYVDEADVDFNPRIGPSWTPRGKQVGIPTPGQNLKHYLAGALNAHTGRVVWTEHRRKTSFLFITLLEA